MTNPYPANSKQSMQWEANERYLLAQSLEFSRLNNTKLDRPRQASGTYKEPMGTAFAIKGFDRKFKNKAQFDRWLGQHVQVKITSLKIL